MAIGWERPRRGALDSWRVRHVVKFRAGKHAFCVSFSLRRAVCGKTKSVDKHGEHCWQHCDPTRRIWVPPNWSICVDADGNGFV